MISPYIRDILLELGMSKEDMADFLAKNIVERTEHLISLFFSRQNDSEKSNIIIALGQIGDVELTAEFYAALLETGNSWIKFYVVLLGRVQRFSGQSRLREALDNYLQGLSPVDALIRDAFPDGFTCPLK